MRFANLFRNELPDAKNSARVTALRAQAWRLFSYGKDHPRSCGWHQRGSAAPQLRKNEGDDQKPAIMPLVVGGGRL
jgi:hypothetical protein